jgi:hypothetical protein
MRYKNNRNPTSRQNPTIVHAPQVLDEQQNTHRNAVSYAQVAAGISNNNSSINSIEQQNTHRIAVSCAQVASGISNNNSSINSIEQLSQNMTDFLGEFKKMFSHLLNQNSMILNMLTTVINKITK